MPRVARRRRRRKTLLQPCGCPQCSMDSNSCQASGKCACQSDFNVAWASDDEALDRRRRRRRRRGSSPCSCPQCALDTDLDQLYEFDAEDEFDHDFGAESPEDAAAPRRRRRRRRRPTLTPCAWSDLLESEEDDWSDEDEDFEHEAEDDAGLLDEFEDEDFDDLEGDEDDEDPEEHEDLADDEDDDLEDDDFDDGEDDLDDFDEDLDEEDSEEFDFDGLDGFDYRDPRFGRGTCRFSDDQKGKIKAAVKLAEQFIAIGLSRLEGINAAGEGIVSIRKRRRAWRRAWNDPGYGKKGLWTKSPAAIWFGKWGRARMKKAIRVLRRMRKNVAKRMVIRPGARLSKKKRPYLGRAVWLSRRRMRIGVPFFKKSPDCQALIIVHELAHGAGIIGDKYRYDALKLSPGRKVRNADSYAYFCLSQYYANTRRGEKDVGKILNETC